MGTVTIAGNVYNIHGTNTAADIYWAAGISDAATAWAAANAATRDKALVQATRILETFRWKGDKTSEAQPLSWPRTGVVDEDGVEQSSATTPTRVEEGNYELAGAILANNAVVTDTTGTNTKRVKAGPVEVEFFRPESGTRLPRVVLEILGWYVESFLATSDVNLSHATGYEVESSFDSDDAFDLSRGL